MMFKQVFHDGIVNGTITRTLRYWKRPQVISNRPYKINPIGHILVNNVTTTGRLTRDDARRSGFEDLTAMKAYLEPFAASDSTLYRVDFEYLGLRADLEPDKSELIDAIELETLARKLDRKDAVSPSPWTRQVLSLINQYPGRSSALLAEAADVDRKKFKQDVRKLKQLGLTVSLEVGYELSPRGRSLIEHESSG